MRATCPRCAATLNFPDSAVGKNVRCPNCRLVFAADAAPAPPPVRDDPDDGVYIRRRRSPNRVMPWLLLIALVFAVAVLVAVVVAGLQAASRVP